MCEHNIFACNTEDIILNRVVWRINLFILDFVPNKYIMNSNEKDSVMVLSRIMYGLSVEYFI